MVKKWKLLYCYIAKLLRKFLAIQQLNNSTIREFSCLAITFLIAIQLFSHLTIFHTVLAESLNVSIRVGETILTFSGKTSPSALVTFLEEGAVVGTTQADGNGNFEKSLTYFSEGIKTVNLYATDSQNRTSSTISYSTSLNLGVNTTVGNIIMPATIVLSQTSLTAGEILTISGEAVISSTVNLYFSDSTSDSMVAGGQGVWQYDYDTSGLNAGDYNVFVKVSSGGVISGQSETKTFSISVLPTVTPIPTSATTGPTATSGPGATATPGPATTLTPTLTPTPTIKLTPYTVETVVPSLKIEPLLTPGSPAASDPNLTLTPSPVNRITFFYKSELFLNEQFQWQWLLITIIIIISALLMLLF